MFRAIEFFRHSFIPRPDWSNSSPNPQCTQSKRTISLGISITIIPRCQSTPLALHWSPLSVVVVAPDDDDDADAPSDLPLILHDVFRSVGGWLFGLKIRTHSDHTNHRSWQCNIMHKSVCQTNVIHSDEDGDTHRSSQGSRKENHHQHVGMQGSSASCTYVRNAEDAADSRIIIIIFPW